MNRISGYLGTVKPAKVLGGIVADSCRSGPEILVGWRQWKDETWALCPFASHDKTVCSAKHCPCAVKQVNLWVNTISGYLGTVKLVKFLNRNNGNGKGAAEVESRPAARDQVMDGGPIERDQDVVPESG
jgi:hypothetical protein